MMSDAGFLIGEVVKGLDMKAGQIKREHYGYEKRGACNLLATIEPLTGRRIFEVTDQRRKVEFARHFQKVAAECARSGKDNSYLG